MRFIETIFHTAVMKDFDQTESAVNLIMNFIKTTEGRTRDVVPNLLTLVGYLAALPIEKLQEIFGGLIPRNKKLDILKNC